MSKNLQAYLDVELSKVNLKNLENEIKEENNIVMEFAQQLIKCREDLNITQKELSNITKIPQTTISRIENGTTNPTLLILQKIVNGLNKKIKIEIR